MIGSPSQWMGQSDPLSFVVFLATLLVVATGAFWLIGIVRWASRPKALSNQKPSVSVIVAARNEVALIRKCLDSLLNQTYPADLFTICLVDDHSTDDTLRVAQDMAAQNPERLKVLSAPPCRTDMGPKKSALRFGISQTRSEVLLFTDADCVVPSGWVETLVRHLGPTTGAVTGAMLPIKRAGFGDRLFRLERLSVSLTTASAIGWGAPASATGGNLAYRRETFERIGGFAHPELAYGDDDLTVQEIAARGSRVEFACGKDSVVADCRIPTMGHFANASARHQGTVKHYPLLWRVVYALSIGSGVAALFCLIAVVMKPQFWPLVWIGFSLRATADLAMLKLFVSRIGEKAGLMDFLLAEFLLPLYSVFRPLLSLLPAFVWRGRVHRSLSQQSNFSG